MNRETRLKAAALLLLVALYACVPLMWWVIGGAVGFW